MQNGVIIMKMLGTNLCIKCENAEKQLKEAGIQFDYVDFTNSIMDLKEFVTFRDTHSEFNSVRGTGKVGIPCFVFDDGTITFDLHKAIELASTK